MGRATLDSDRRCGRWLDLVGELLQRPLSQLPVELIARTLLETFDGNQSAYVVREPPGRVYPRLWPAPSRALLADTLEWARDRTRQAEHPLVHWFTVSGDLEAQSVGHVPVSFRNVRLLASWHEMSTPHGIEHQMSLPVYWHGGRDAVFIISRQDEDFTDEDLVLARRVQRLIVGLDRQARALATSGWTTEHVEPPPRSELSGRELTVLNLLPTGLTTAAIARRLSISPRTVDKHLENIYRKLGTSDRLTTVLRAQRLQLLQRLDGAPAVASTT